MTKQELKEILKRYYKKTMINAILRGSKPMHINYAKELHQEGILDFSAWVDIVKYLEDQES